MFDLVGFLAGSSKLENPAEEVIVVLLDEAGHMLTVQHRGGLKPCALTTSPHCFLVHTKTQNGTRNTHGCVYVSEA